MKTRVTSASDPSAASGRMKQLRCLPSSRRQCMPRRGKLSYAARSRKDHGCDSACSKQSSGRAEQLRGNVRRPFSTNPLKAPRRHRARIKRARTHASTQVLRCSARSMKRVTTYAPVSRKPYAARRPPSAPSERGQIKPRGTRQRPPAHTTPTLLTHSSSATTTRPRRRSR